MKMYVLIDLLIIFVILPILGLLTCREPFAEVINFIYFPIYALINIYEFTYKHAIRKKNFKDIEEVVKNPNIEIINKLTKEVINKDSLNLLLKRCVSIEKKKELENSKINIQYLYAYALTLEDKSTITNLLIAPRTQK